MTKKIKITINGREFTAILADNPTAAVFAEKLPFRMTMNELNGNEKYCRLEKNFPVQDFCPEQIKTGDLMLYGSNTVVLFYKNFNTTYSYTPLGHIENISELVDVVGSDKVNVQIKLCK